MVHATESWLLALSDQQLASAIALIFTLNYQACTISAYDYNVACSMLLLSVVVHFSSLVMVSDYLYRHTFVSLSRVLAILVQLVLTGILFLARNTAMFPFRPSSLAIMPAACFENTTVVETAGLANFIDFVSNVTTNATLTTTNTTGNGTETLWHNISAEVSPVHGLPEYFVLFGTTVAGLITLVYEWHGARKFHDTNNNRPHSHSGWIPIAISIISTVIGFIVAGVVWARYADLTRNMKVNEWYQEVPPVTSLSQILPLSLLGISIFPVIHAFFGKPSFNPIVGRGYTDVYEFYMQGCCRMTRIAM